MGRIIDDKDYIECLAAESYRRQYARWRERQLRQIDAISDALAEKPIEEVMREFQLSPRDVALLVRLHYFTRDEVIMYDLEKIEQGVPV